MLLLCNIQCCARVISSSKTCSHPRLIVNKIETVIQTSFRKMCVLYFCQNEIWKSDGYRLIIANNRDEFWDRPTKEVDFWDKDGSSISGLDAEQNREGGTWLGMNKNGKVGVLLNILGQQDSRKQPRGKLVSDFISGPCDIDKYSANVHKSRNTYNGFNLILFDIGQEESLSVKPVYVSNAASYWSCVTKRNLPANTFFGVSNSPLEFPFQKVVQGKAKFGQIISQYPSVNSREHLIDKLMNLMQDRTSLLPDPPLESAAYPFGFSQTRVMQHSAINVHQPEVRYGSRTSTVLLIDSSGSVDYVERTTDFCSNDNGVNPVKTVHKTFSLSPNVDFS